ncbi:MAG: PAS domain S-box protein [Holophagaceae bacterium]|nr:PAS domain S-box protein [Holophagaceae bacterium]
MRYLLKQSQSYRRISLVVFVASTIGLLAAGYWYFRAEANNIRRTKHEELAAICKMKSAQIQRWRKERLDDARRVERDPLLSQAAEKFLRIPRSLNHRADLMERLLLERMGDEYHEVLLYTLDGRKVLSTLDTPALTDPATQRIIQVVLISKEPQLSDFFREVDGTAHIDLAAVVRGVKGQPLAVVILRILADDYLFPLIQSWPTPSPSAETLLVQRDGEEIVFLNHLRHRPKSTLALRDLVSKSDLAAREALFGKHGEFQGKDYRGVQVLADLRPIPDSPWFMVAKVDADEILAEARYRAGMIGLVVGSLILLAAAATAYVYRRQQAGLFRDLYDLERQEHETQKTFRATLYSIGDGVITTDRGGLVRGMNPVAEKLTGWTEADAQSKPLEQVFCIMNEDTRTTMEHPVDQVLRLGAVAGLANHTLLIARDGTECPIADSAAPIRDDNGAISGAVLVFSDKTAERAAQKALQASEQHLRAIIEAEPECVKLSDQHGKLLEMNAAGLAMLEADSLQEVQGCGLLAFIRPEFHAAFSSLHERVVRGGSGSLEFDLTGLKGTRRWLDLRAVPMCGANGQVPMVLGICRDITERKRAEASLRLQSTALQAAANAIVIADRHGVIEWVNAAFSTMTGYSVAESIGKRPGDLLKSGKQGPDFYNAMWSILHAGEVWQGEIINRRKDGTHYTEGMTITPLKDDQSEITHFIAIKQDITERVQSAHEIHEYIERLEAMRAIDAALLGARSTTELARGALARLRHIVPFERAAVVLFDQGLTEGSIMAVDQVSPWLPLAGEVRPISDFHDPKDLLSAPFLDLPDLSEIHGSILEELLLSQGLHDLIYIPMESEDTVLGFVALSATTAGLLTLQHAEIALDMTDQLVVAIQHTRLREELELSNELLESKVEKRTADLRTTVATMQVLEEELRQREAEARAANEAKSTFLSSMSHELRTPLIGVTGMLEVLTQSDLDAEQRRVANIIHESSDSLLQIIGDILDFSKIEANKLELAPGTFSVRELMESVSQTFRSAISSKSLQFILDVDPMLAPAHVADALRIRQILNNFLSNALKFTESGSIALRLRVLESNDGDESLAFDVEDTGIGVSPENQAKLFSPFAQAEASTTRRFGGTGLGLVISRRLAELMGGSLTMRSTLGQGTTMTLAVDLPVGNVQDLVKPEVMDSSKTIPVRPAPSIEMAEQERSLILLAEDHPTNRIVLTQQVHRAGYALEVAVDGQEAFEMWQSGRYAVILADLHMPRMDGYQLTQAVRDLERAHPVARTPILALTANAMGGEAERCLELGMDDYLIKPVTIPFLASKLHPMDAPREVWRRSRIGCNT